MVEAVRQQLDHFTHVCFPVSTYEPYVELAEKLNALTPGGHEKRTFFVNSGAEAVENAVKAARHFTGRQAIVCFEHAFHGRTYLAMALTSKVMPYKKGFGPFAPEVYRMPFPYCYRCVRGGGRSDGSAEVARAAWRVASTWNNSSRRWWTRSRSRRSSWSWSWARAASFRHRPNSYKTLAAFAKDHGILFIADEIQTGFGRTGKMFASEHYGLVPDLMTTAKSLAGGLPLAAVTGRADVLESAQPGGLGGTYGGNPLACAAALAVLDAMKEDRLAERGAKIGERIRVRFQKWAERFPR